MQICDEMKVFIYEMRFVFYINRSVVEVGNASPGTIPHSQATT